MGNAHNGESIVLLLDWDGTLSQEDTIETLANIAYSYHEETGRQLTLRPWQEIVDAYCADYERHRKEYRPAEADRCTLQDETHWLESLRQVELRSLKRISEAGIFHGVPGRYISTKAGQAIRDINIMLRSGWLELFAVAKGQAINSSQVTGGNDFIGLISVNWSKCFIKSCIVAAYEMGIQNRSTQSINSVQKPESTLSQSAIEKLSVQANEMDFDGKNTDGATGLFETQENGPLITASDKARAMAEVQRHNSIAQEAPSSVVYIGDSTTDLLCLLNADVGICIRDVPMSSSQKHLAETLSRLGVAVRPLENLQLRPLESKLRQSREIYYVTGLPEVTAWLMATSELA